MHNVTLVYNAQCDAVNRATTTAKNRMHLTSILYFWKFLCFYVCINFMACQTTGPMAISQDSVLSLKNSQETQLICVVRFLTTPKRSTVAT